MTDYDDLLARAEMAESAMDNLARKLTATEAERDEAREQRNQAQMTWDDEHDARLKSERDGLRAEASDLRSAWAILGEPDESIRSAHTASEAARQFVTLLSAARAEARAAQAHVAMLREALTKTSCPECQHLVHGAAGRECHAEDKYGWRFCDCVLNHHQPALAATDAEARREALEEALAEMCEHVGRVVEPKLVTEIRNELALLAQPAEPKEEP
jgi:hypothetical protein